LGTFLVRSGILISVHAFANDSARGLYLLEFLALIVGASLALYAWRSHKITHSGHYSLLSRESALLGNNLLLFIAMITVLIGTLYPLIVAVMHLPKLSVGAPYFNTVFFPLMLPLLLLMGFAPHLHWRQTRKYSLKWLSIVFMLALLLAIGVSFLIAHQFKPITVIGVFLALWIIFNLPRRQYAMMFAHLGVAITVLGLLFVSLYTQHRNVLMRPGDSTSMAGYVFHLDKVTHLEGPNYSGAQATVSIRQGSRLVDILYPQQRVYRVERIAVAKTAINVGVFRDLYVALGAPLDNGMWGLRLYYKPMVRWIWWGGFLMVIGGLFALIGMRRRDKRES